MQIQTEGVMPLIPEQEDVVCPPSHIGLAVDVGTTTVAVTAWQLATRECLGTVAAKNLQMRYGFVKLGQSEGTFVVDAYPVSVQASDLLLTFITVLLVSLIAVWLPVRRMTRYLISEE